MIVILAILAAILVPGLLKWIDKAKEEQYVLEARNVYLAAEAEVAQLYAKGTTVDDVTTALKDADGTSIDNIEGLADVENLKITAVTFRTAESGETISKTQGYDIVGMDIEFKSSRGKTVTANLANGAWTAKEKE